jgi:hypothetical protein
VDDLALVLEGQGVQHDVTREVVDSILRLTVALVALKLIALAIDPTIRLYLGDSVAYLWGAMDSGRLPDDRSFTYAFLIRGLVRPFESLTALVVWQSLAGIAIALLAWHIMVRRLALPRTLAAAGACLLAIEPAQLYYERMVLAETFGLLAFVLFVAATAAYVASGRAWWLPLAALLGLAAASLRLNYLPIVIAMSVATPLVRRLGASRPTWRQTAVHAMVALASVAVLHTSYQLWVAWIFKSPPGYLARAGFMQLGLVLPLVTAEHLASVGLPSDFAAQLQYPISDPDSRMRHMWAPGGFIRELRARNIPIEPVARPLAQLAVRSDPLGLLRLGIGTVADYFNEEGIRHALENDLGRRVIPEEVLWTLREKWYYDANGLWARQTAVSRYFESGTWALVACLFLLGPLALVNVRRQWATPQRAQAVVAALVAVGLVLAHILFVPVAFYRYLHPLPLFVLLNGLPLIARSVNAPADCGEARLHSAADHS